MNIKKVIHEIRHGVLTGEREWLIADTGLFIGYILGVIAGTGCTLLVWLLISLL